MNIGSSDHLTQIQHKGSRVDIVDHLDHGELGVDAHIITSVNQDGSIKTSIKGK
jgi:hypothetical protein